LPVTTFLHPGPPSSWATSPFRGHLAIFRASLERAHAGMSIATTNPGRNLLVGQCGDRLSERRPAILPFTGVDIMPFKVADPHSVIAAPIDPVDRANAIRLLKALVAAGANSNTDRGRLALRHSSETLSAGHGARVCSRIRRGTRLDRRRSARGLEDYHSCGRARRRTLCRCGELRPTRFRRRTLLNFNPPLHRSYGQLLIRTVLPLIPSPVDN
jgi:hypothetical protein